MPPACTSSVAASPERSQMLCSKSSTCAHCACVMDVCAAPDCGTPRICARHAHGTHLGLHRHRREVEPLEQEREHFIVALLAPAPARARRCALHTTSGTAPPEARAAAGGHRRIRAAWDCHLPQLLLRRQAVGQLEEERLEGPHPHLLLAVA